MQTIGHFFFSLTFSNSMKALVCG